MWQFFYYATCHNFKPSLIIIMDDEDQYFKKKIISMSKNFIVPHVKLKRMNDN
jgi:hypothetical protein